MRRNAAVLLIIFFMGISIVSFSLAERPLTPQDMAKITQAQHQVRGQDDKLVQFIGSQSSSVTVDTSLITSGVAFLTALTLLFSLLSKYLIGPMIRDKLDDFGARLVSKEQFEEYKENDQRDHERLEKSVNAIWRAVGKE